MRRLRWQQDRPDEIQLYYRNAEGIKKHDITKIITFEQLEEKLGNFFEWYNNCWNHSGQGMDGKTPTQVWAENAVPKREKHADIKKYLFTMRYQKTVQKNGIRLDGGWYYKDEMLKYTGQKAEVRVPLDFSGVVHVFSLPDRKYLFDAELIEFTGDVEKDNKTVNKLREGKKILLAQYNKKKKEYDAGPFLTSAEIYARDKKIAGGEPLGGGDEEASNMPAIPIKKTLLFA